MALSSEDSLSVVKIFKELWMSSMHNDSTVLVDKFDSLWKETLHSDSLRVSNIFKNLWDSARYNDSLINCQSSKFYSDSFSSLVATNVGLFTALITVAVAIFVFKYWIDNKAFDEKYENRLNDEVKKIEKKFKALNEIDYSVARRVYSSTIRSIMKIDGKQECTKDLIELINAYIALDKDKRKLDNKKQADGSVIGFCVLITDLFDRILQTEKSDELASCSLSLLETVDYLLDEDEDVVMHINEDLYDKVLEKYGTDELKQKEEDRRQKRANARQPKNLCQRFEAAWNAFRDK